MKWGRRYMSSFVVKKKKSRGLALWHTLGTPHWCSASSRPTPSQIYGSTFSLCLPLCGAERITVGLFRTPDSSPQNIHPGCTSQTELNVYYKKRNMSKTLSTSKSCGTTSNFITSFKEFSVWLSWIPLAHPSNEQLSQITSFHLVFRTSTMLS